MPFRSGSDWEQSSGPIISRKVHLTAQDEATAILWPQGGNFDTLTAGEHPILAFGRVANRPKNITGVVMSYDGTVAILNVADKFISRQYVANIASYSDSNQVSSWQNTVFPGDPVFVDDSEPVYTLSTGCTLTFSPLNSLGSANPLAGYVFYCQDEYQDDHVGGPNTAAAIPQPAAADTTELLTLCVMQVNDHGDSEVGRE